MRWLFIFLILASCSKHIDLKTTQQQTPKVVSIELTSNMILLAHSGSGVVIAEDKDYSYIITARHVVMKSFFASLNYVTVSPAKMNGRYCTCNESLTGEVLAISDTFLDIALIKTKVKFSSIARLSSADPQVGQNVYISGYPAATYEIVINKGIISRLQEVGDHFFICTDASVLPGNSGGGIFNETGECVGIMQEVMYDSPNHNRGISSIEVRAWLKSIKREDLLK